MNMKKEKRGKIQQLTAPAKVPGISKAGKKIIAAGIGLLVIGYFILTKTDPAGQNWASTVSPFLILGGYAVIGIGIIFPEKETPSPQQ